MKTKYRDLIIIIVIVLITIIGYFMISNAYKKTTFTNSIIKYRDTIVADVDFENKKVSLIDQENNSVGYPKHDSTNNTITILGDYKIDGIRQEIVIKYNLEDRTMQVIEEESPNNTCLKQGVSNGKPISCIPNNVIIVFISSGTNYDDII